MPTSTLLLDDLPYHNMHEFSEEDLVLFFALDDHVRYKELGQLLNRLDYGSWRAHRSRFRRGKRSRDRSKRDILVHLDPSTFTCNEEDLACTSLASRRARLMLLAFCYYVPSKLHATVRYKQDAILRALWRRYERETRTLNAEDCDWLTRILFAETADPRVRTKAYIALLQNPDASVVSEDLLEFFKQQPERYADYDYVNHTPLNSTATLFPLASHDIKVYAPVRSVFRNALATTHDNTFVGSNAAWTLAEIGDPGEIPDDFTLITEHMRREMVPSRWLLQGTQRNTVSCVTALERMIHQLNGKMSESPRTYGKTIRKLRNMVDDESDVITRIHELIGRVATQGCPALNDSFVRFGSERMILLNRTM